MRPQPVKFTIFRKLITLILVIFTSRRAIASVSLPLDGCCRSGRCFPVAVDGIDAQKTLTFHALGCQDSQMTAGGGERIVPMLVTGTVHELHWDGGSLALQMLKDDERLVASSSDHVDPNLFPGKQIWVVHADATDPLPGPAVAWETLDAVVLDSIALTRIDDEKRSALLAGGVTLAAVGDRPDRRWPWQHIGKLWILSQSPLGPTDDLISEDAYAPTYGWSPGLSKALRLQVMGIATLLLLITFGLLLLRQRWAVIAIVALAILTSGGVVIYRHTLGTIDRAGGDIFVAGSPLLQRDSWVFQRAKDNSVQTVPFAGWTHPIFASAGGIDQTDLGICLSADDQLSFQYQAAAGHSLAFVRREIRPGSTPAVLNQRDSPMQETAKDLYLAPHTRIVGQTIPYDQRWPAVVISR